jgi:hypothetical protein
VHIVNGIGEVGSNRRTAEQSHGRSQRLVGDHVEDQHVKDVEDQHVKDQEVQRCPR